MNELPPTTKHATKNLALFGAGLLLGLIAGMLVYSIFGQHQALLNSKLLDWPFLSAVLLICFVGVFFEALSTVLSRSEFTIVWGKDQMISVKNLSSAVTGELDPVREDIAALKQAISSLKKHPEHLGNISDTNSSEEAIGSEGDEQTNALRLQRLREGLKDPRFKWRSVGRLATSVGASEDEATALLITMDDVRLSRGISGNQIAGLRNRVGQL